MHSILRPAAGLLAAAVLFGAVACSDARVDTPATTAGGDNTPAAAATTTTSGAQPASTSNLLSVEDLVNKVEASVVRIETDGGVGTGFVIDGDGYIITNNHVVQGARGGVAARITVTMSDDTDYPAEVIGTDARADLALIKIDASGLKALPIGSLAETEVGQEVVAVGYALDLRGGEGASYTVTRGIVSAKNRAIDEGATGILGSVQTDAAINHGNSGGPLLNLKGEVIGVNTALQPDSATGGVAQGIGYAVGADTIKAVYEQLRESGKVNRGLLGVTNFSELRAGKAREIGLPEGTKGVLLSNEGARGTTVAPVSPGGPAAVAGIRANDVITKIGGDDIRTEADLAIAMIKHGPGESVEVELFRGTQKMTVNVTLGSPAA